ncbi:MAG: NADH-quinone oxidoreductase subunit M [Actinomycetota bacterium]|nr:NADH-quinone oxidoreductase subunit M [Acidimicrobiia bacterium]MDQ3293406.1 NADH-quinone oxidoreductase subunit M [Actinomycetota bacterium]
MHEEAALSFDILTSLVAVPAVGAVLVALVSRRRPELTRQLALLMSLLTGALAVWLMLDFHAGEADFQYQHTYTWIRELGISWKVGVDGISLFLVVLTGILFPLAILGAKPHHDSKPYHAWLLLLEAGCMGVFLALDLFMFFVMFEIVLVPMYFLIGGWGYGERVYAAMKFFLFTMLGSAFMLVSIITLAFLHRRGSGGDLTFDLVTIASNLGPDVLSQNAARWLFLGFAVAFAVKVPLFPLHTWLPDAHTQAPTAGSVILAGVMLKLGTYGFLRFGIYLFPEAARWFAPLFLTLGTIGIIYGAIVATMQKDLKRLVAYSSVAHLGFIVLGSFAMTNQSLQGAVLQSVNHGITTPALFLLVGFIYERRHTRQIAELKGLQKAAPVLAGVFTLVMLSSIGVPGLNGFSGEFLILIGSFLTARWWTVVATAGVILAALYLLWAYQRVFHGEPDGDNANVADLKLSEGLVLAPLLALIVFLGVYPKPVLERIEPSVERLIEHVEANSNYREPEPVGAVEAGGHGEGAAEDGGGAEGEGG